METPYAGRAIINSFYDGVAIIIPAKEPLFAVVGKLVFQCLTLAFVIFFCTALFSVAGQGGRTFAYGLIAVWTVANIFYTRRTLWGLAGKEVITVFQGVLTINRKNDFLSRAKTYDLALCSNFFAFEEQRPIMHPYNRTADMLRPKVKPGTIKFDYDVVDTVQFGDWLPQAEGEYIIKCLKDKKLIN